MSDGFLAKIERSLTAGHSLFGHVSNLLSNVGRCCGIRDVGRLLQTLCRLQQGDLARHWFIGRVQHLCEKRQRTGAVISCGGWHAAANLFYKCRRKQNAALIAPKSTSFAVVLPSYLQRHLPFFVLETEGRRNRPSGLNRPDSRLSSSYEC